MKIILISVVLLWITVAVRGLAIQGPVAFWHTITSRTAIAPDAWGRWALPVLMMRYTFTPVLLAGLGLLWLTLLLLQALAEVVAHIPDEHSDDNNIDGTYIPSSRNQFFNHDTGKYDDGLRVGTYDWDL